MSTEPLPPRPSLCCSSLPHPATRANVAHVAKAAYNMLVTCADTVYGALNGKKVKADEATHLLRAVRHEQCGGVMVPSIFSLLLATSTKKRHISRSFSSRNTP